MKREILKSKIHGAVITAVRPEYEGSLTIPTEIMKDADILPYEKVLVLNLNTGDRFETYAIPGTDPYSFECNGPAARLAQVNDIVFVLTFVSIRPEDLKSHRIRIVRMEDRNRKHQTVVRDYGADI